MVLGQLPPRKIVPNPKTNPQPNLTLTEEQLFLRAIVWLPPKPKTNPDLDPNPNHNRGGQFSSGAIVRIPKHIHQQRDFSFYQLCSFNKKKTA